MCYLGFIDGRNLGFIALFSNKSLTHLSRHAIKQFLSQDEKRYDKGNGDFVMPA